MNKERFFRRIIEEYTAECQMNKLPLDFRAYKAPYTNTDCHECFDICEIEQMWDFIKDAEEWYVDIYENWVEDNRAEFVDRCIASWEKEKTEPLKQVIMRNYGNTINQLYQTLAKKAEGVRICDFKNIDTMVDIYEEDNSTIFFYFNKLLRGAVFDTDTDRPYISKTFHVWNNVYDDWDEVTFEKDIPLKPNEIIVEDNSTPFQIAVLNWDTNTIDVISTSLDPDADIEIWLEEQGYDLNWCYYTCGKTLQFNFKTIKG